MPFPSGNRWVYPFLLLNKKSQASLESHSLYPFLYYTDNNIPIQLSFKSDGYPRFSSDHVIKMKMRNVFSVPRSPFFSLLYQSSFNICIMILLELSAAISPMLSNDSWAFPSALSDIARITTNGTSYCLHTTATEAPSISQAMASWLSCSRST